MINSLITSLFLTLVIEIFIAIMLGIRTKNDIFVVICANICTNPVVVFTANCISLLNNFLIYWIAVVILEMLAVIVEYILYKQYLKFKKLCPFVISFICNAISFGTGLVIYYFK